jgi:hypothetical protein
MSSGDLHSNETLQRLYGRNQTMKTVEEPDEIDKKYFKDLTHKHYSD